MVQRLFGAKETRAKGVSLLDVQEEQQGYYSCNWGIVIRSVLPNTLTDVPREIQELGKETAQIAEFNFFLFHFSPYTFVVRKHTQIRVF